MAALWRCRRRRSKSDAVVDKTASIIIRRFNHSIIHSFSHSSAYAFARGYAALCRVAIWICVLVYICVDMIVAIVILAIQVYPDWL